MFREFAFYFFNIFIFIAEVVPLTCRLCLGLFAAFRCFIIMENQRGFALIFVTGHIRIRRLDKPGPFRVREVWTSPQRFRI